MKSQIKYIVILPLLFFFLSNTEMQSPLYKDVNAPIEDRVNDLLKRLTLDEKIELLGGTGFASKAIERLGIPELKMADGPVGVRWGAATALPSGIALASSWDTLLAKEYGKILALETKGKGRNVILGPCVNIARLPMGGRNFESFGEDPYLTSRLAVNYIKGVQNENVVATVKHFACNNQEHERDFVDVRISERALNEIYLPHFKASVEEADVMAVMSAYNKVNGPYASENDYLLIDKLKKEWNFKGLVMSDWGAVHSTIATANSGLDLEMPNGKFLNNETLSEAIKNGLVKESTIDEKVKRILYVVIASGIFDNETKEDASLINTIHSKTLTYNVAKDGIVLLKNSKNILPLDLTSVKKIGVIGTSAITARTGGGGSSMVNPVYTVSPFEGLKNKLPNTIQLNYAPGVQLDGDIKSIESKFLFLPDESSNGLKAEYFKNVNLSGKPALIKTDLTIDFDWKNEPPFENFPKDNYSVRWTGKVKPEKSGNYTFDVMSDDGVRFYINDKLVINDWNDHSAITNSYTMALDAAKSYSIKLEYYENGGDAVVKLGWREQNDNLLLEAVNLAKESDLVLVFAGTSYQYETEGRDRNDLILPNNQDKLITEISKVNDKVVVILTTGSPILMNDWVENIEGLLQLWFAGSEGGNAIADVLLGNVNPSGKLPMTFPKLWEDCSAFESYKKLDSITYYSDDIFVGYRHFENKKIIPLFPFGYGLSYTSFEYDKIKLSANEMRENQQIDLSFEITNSGKIKGAEIAQLYISDINSSVIRPQKELKGFAKVELNPGETKSVSMKIDKSSLSFYDEKAKSFITEPGEFEVLIGSSSSDIKLKKTFTLNK
jgi:beta-glucosidase